MPDVLVLDPLFSDDEADRAVELWHRHARGYGLYSNEGFPTSFAPQLAQRYDAAVNFVRTGGRFGRAAEEPALLAARTNYLRETYAYGDELSADIDWFFRHGRLVDAASELHGRPVVVPAILYANVLLPGQELAVHTDVPEFRGANRKVVPQWLLVVMLHSGLFESWRMPIATAIAYFGNARGGELAYYPDGATGAVATHTPTHNSAVVLDTDNVFHGVDRVEGDESALGTLRPGMRLHHEGAGRWALCDGEAEVSSFTTEDLRYSVSWKGYCFADDGEREAWAQHTDDLSLELILGRLVDDLCRRGRLASPDHGLADAELGRLLIDEYIRFPAPAPA